MAALTHLREQHAHGPVHRLVLGANGTAASFTGEKPQPGAERGQTQEDSLKSGSRVSCWSAQDSGQTGAQSGNTRHKQKALCGGKTKTTRPPTLTSPQGTNDLGWSLPSRELGQRNFQIIGRREVCFEIKMGTVGTSYS